MANKFPHLYRVDGRPLPGLPPRVQREVTAACDAIRRRTGYQAWYHAKGKSVQYHRGERPRYGSAQDVLVNSRGYHPIDVESACQRVLRSRASMDKKLAALERAERANTDARERALAKHADDIGGSLVDEILHQVRRSEDPHGHRVFSFS